MIFVTGSKICCLCEKLSQNTDSVPHRRRTTSAKTPLIQWWLGVLASAPPASVFWTAYQIKHQISLEILNSHGNLPHHLTLLTVLCDSLGVQTYKLQCHDIVFFVGDTRMVRCCVQKFFKSGRQKCCPSSWDQHIRAWSFESINSHQTRNQSMQHFPKQGRQNPERVHYTICSKVLRSKKR